LHADECAKRVAGYPQPTMVGVDRLHPVERRRSIPDFAYPAIVTALAAPDAAEVEPHDGAAQPLERLIHRIGNSIVHRSAVQRMGMKDQRHWGTGFLRMVVTAFEPTIRAGKHHLGHGL